MSLFDSVVIPDHLFGVPLDSSTDEDQGDPCVYVSLKRQKIYIFVTRQNEHGAIGVYEANLDISNLRFVGMAIQPPDYESDRCYWAAWVGEDEYGNIAMIVSRSMKRSQLVPSHLANDFCHIGHRLTVWRPIDNDPTKSFVFTGTTLTTKLSDKQAFYIDPDVNQFGKNDWRIIYSINFLSLPFGTGVVMQKIAPDFSRLIGKPQVIFRNFLPDYKYAYGRHMPWLRIAGVRQHLGDRLDWHTGEAGILIPGTFDEFLIAGGNYGGSEEDQNDYFMSHLKITTNKETQDLVGKGHFAIRSNDIPGIFAPGHGDFVFPDREDTVIIHGRTSPHGPRKMILTRGTRNERGWFKLTA